MSNKHATGKKKIREYRVISFRIEVSTYEKLLRLKIAMGDGGSFNGWLNKELAKVVNSNDVLIKGYEVDYSEF